jgi:hypothetical protein
MKLGIFPIYMLAVSGLFSNCEKSSSSNGATEPCTTIEADSIAIASKQLTLSDAARIIGAICPAGVQYIYTKGLYDGI